MQPATILFALAAAAATVDAFPPLLPPPAIAGWGGAAGVVALEHKAVNKFREWKHPSRENTGEQLQRRGTPRRVHKKKEKEKNWDQIVKEGGAKEKAEKKAKEHYVRPVAVGATWDCFWTNNWKVKTNQAKPDPPRLDFVMHGRNWNVTDVEMINAAEAIEYGTLPRRRLMKYSFNATRDPPGDKDMNAVNFTVAFVLEWLDASEVENVGKPFTQLLGIEWTPSTDVHCAHSDVGHGGKKRV